MSAAGNLNDNLQSPAFEEIPVFSDPPHFGGRTRFDFLPDRAQQLTRFRAVLATGGICLGLTRPDVASRIDADRSVIPASVDKTITKTIKDFVDIRAQLRR